MPDSTRSIRVLIVDDEEIIASTLQKVFALKGYEAVAVHSAEAALALLPDWLPDVAILDVCLPGMNGIDLAIRLKAEYPTCQLALISGDATTADLLLEASSAGHTLDVLAKPIHPSVLLDLVAGPKILPA
jgi:CheY-like chemotaxis protein